MASKFHFVPGDDWVKKVNNFMDEYYGNDSGPITSGITYSTGVTDANGGHSIIYRTYSSKSGIGLVLYGGVRVPINIIRNSTGDIIAGKLITLPISSVSMLGDAGGLPYLAPSTAGQVRLSLDRSNGVLTVAAIGGSTATWVKNAKTTDTMWIDISHIFPIYK